MRVGAAVGAAPSRNGTSAVADSPLKPASAGPREPASDRRADDHLRVRLGLQRRAASNVRRHVVRSARRLSVLLLAGLGAVCGVALLVRTVRQGGVLGDSFASAFHALFPAGSIASPQYLVALFLAL